MKQAKNLSLFLFLVFALGACSPRGGRNQDEDGGMRSVDGGSSCADTTDTDGDGIADVVESDVDSDGDGTPNHLDDDSDGDGIPDAEEAGTGNPCWPQNSDSDAVPDFLDTDSDNDGLSDATEAAEGTNPRQADSDGDGVSDLGERAAGTDPNDRTSTIPAGDFFVVLPYEGEHEMRPLSFGTNITQADVYFLVDMTGSMRGERTTLIDTLVSTVVPGIQEAIPDVHFGAGGFDDYPYGVYGGPNDLPYYNLRDIAPFEEDIGAWSVSTASCPNEIGMVSGSANGRPDILEAIEGLPCHGGADGPESYVPAMHATATGNGLPWPGGEVAARGACPMHPDERGTRIGYPCFRPGSLPIMILVGDSTFHNGPGDVSPYSWSGVDPAPDYASTVTALNGIGARVIGVTSGTQSHFESIATDTGAVRADGSPLVFRISNSGAGLDSAIVDAVAQLVGGTPQDVGTQVENGEGNPDDFDAALFIKSIVPFEGYNGGASGPMPGITYESKDDTTFYQLIPGTRAEFTVDFWNDVRPPAETAEIFRATIVVLGNGVARLDERNVYIVVPPDGGGPIII